MSGELGFAEGLAAAWALFHEAILAAVIAGAALGWLGVHVLLRRRVFAAAALTQGAGLGVALSFLAAIHLGLELPPQLGALAISGLIALLLTARVEKLRLSPESLLAFLWVTASASAVLVGDLIVQEAHDIAAILFGSAVLVTPGDLLLVGVGGVLSLVSCALAHPGLVISAFDPEGARVQGLPVRLIEVGFLGLLTLMVSVSTRALGALPVFAFSVLPAISALLCAPSLRLAGPLAALFGGLAGLLGFGLAFTFDLPVGAAEAAVAVALVGVAAPFRRLTGAP
jgi:zinc transport system permease protein